MTYLSISEDKARILQERMRYLHISEEEIKETFIRSSGPGGQNANKVATCVFLQHIPTGIQVKCERERSQNLNRYYARCFLLDKIEKRREEIRRSQIQAVQKEKRKNRQRPAFLKEKILQSKHERSEKKRIRAKVKTRQWDEY